MSRDAHQPFLATYRGFTAFEARALPSVQATCLDALCDALLLVFASLVDGDGMALLNRGGSGCGCCLSKAKR
jgi:hypothetical protein